MKSWIKQLHHLLHVHFIPSHKNAYRPHFLRAKAVAFILCLVLVLEAIYLAGASFVLPRSDYFAAIFATVLVDQTNKNRVTENLSTLTPNTKLEYAAQLKANDMAAKGYFSHNSPDGKTPWHWFQLANYDYAAAGENLAVNFTDSTDVSEAWMHSPTHRANIMNGNYTEIGIATAQGIYKGKEAIFVVQMFGRPSLVAREITIVPTIAQASTPVTQIVPVASSTKTLGAETVFTPKKKPIVTQKLTPIPTPTPKPTSTPLVAQAEVIVTPPPLASTTVAGAETKKLDTIMYAVDAPILERTHASKFELLLASPRQATNMIYLILAAIVLAALGLAVFIKIRIQYPHSIAYGILLVSMLLSLVVLNAALGFTRGTI